MRIEMATAAAPTNAFVEEFSEPVSIIYGRSNSDRANYAKTARKEDLHLAAWLGAYALAHPSAAPTLARMMGETTKSYARALRKGGSLPPEQWRVRGVVEA